MTHDDILKAARERIAEIDKQTAALAEERGKLQAMLSPTRFVAPLPVAPPLPAGPGLPWHEPPWWPLPEVMWWGGSATTLPLYIGDNPPADFVRYDVSPDIATGTVYGPGPRLGTGIRFTS